jgi:hypothetical protein
MPDNPSDETLSVAPETVRVHCDECGVDVVPAGRGLCPTCGRFLPGNEVALIHGGRRMATPKERESRRTELRDQVMADLGGDLPPIIREVAEDFVSACVLRDILNEHLEVVGPLTQRGNRRAAMDMYLATSARIERLSVQLNAYREERRRTAAPVAAPSVEALPPSPGIEVMPTSAVELGVALLRRVVNGEQLTEREQGQLDVLRSAMRGYIVLPPDAPLGVEAVTPAPTPPPAAAPEVPAPTPDPYGSVTNKVPHKPDPFDSTGYDPFGQPADPYAVNGRRTE